MKKYFEIILIVIISTILSNMAFALPGDVNANNAVELGDAVLSLQIAAGIPVLSADLGGDVNQDSKIGLEEAIFALQKAAYSEPGRARAVLGPLSDATINVYNLTSPDTSLYTTQTDSEGYFDTFVSSLAGNEYILVTASGGQDTDADDDGISDAVSTPNNGTIHALMTVSEFNTGGFTITALSDIAYRFTRNLVGEAANQAIGLRQDDLAKLFFTEDINGDDIIDAKDLLAFTPSNVTHQEKLNFSFDILFEYNTDGYSIIDCYHDDLEDILDSLLEEKFGSTRPTYILVCDVI